MKNLINIIFLVLLTTGFSFINAQVDRVLIDGLFDDWSSSEFLYTDNFGDGEFGYDFGFLAVNNDENYLFFSFDVGLEINLQQNNDIVLIIDTDDDEQTGYKIDGIGAEIMYNFGLRGGFYFNDGKKYKLKHSDIGLITAPTISSERFELGLLRNSTYLGNALFQGDSMKIILLQDVSDGDKIPNEPGGFSYSYHDDNLVDLPHYSFVKPVSSDFRVLSFNVLKDRMFEVESPFRRQIRAINPDIIGFQEIYNHSAAQTQEKVENYLGGDWYSAKQGKDIIIVSKYPILASYLIKGNGAFLLDVDSKEVLFINAHLPCCGNDSGRQEEVDAMMAFVRDAKEGNNNLHLKPGTPVIIVGDMNFVGKSRQVNTIKDGDIYNENQYGPDFNPDWDDTPIKDVLAYTTDIPFAMTWYDEYSSYNPGRLDYIFYSDAVLQLHNSFSLFTSRLNEDSLQHYQLELFDSENASDHLPVVADFSFDMGTNTNQLSGQQKTFMELFPNPCQQEVNIRFPGLGISNATIDVFDIFGKPVLSKTIAISLQGIQTIYLSTKSLHAGVYMIQLKQGKYSITEKLLKIH